MGGGLSGLGFEDQNVPTRKRTTITRALPFTRPCHCASGKKLFQQLFFRMYDGGPILCS